MRNLATSRQYRFIGVRVLLTLGGLLALSGLQGCKPNVEEHLPNRDAMGQLMNQGNTTSADPDSPTDFQQVIRGYQFQFPRDNLAHNDFRQEWWYLTANLVTDAGEALGLQWTQFRIATQAPQTTKPQSDWQTLQLYMAHSAITDEQNHLSAEKWSRAHPQLAGVQASPFRVFLDNWQWQSETQDLFPATLSVGTDEFGYRLQLNSQAQLQLQGDKGFSVKSHDANIASYYYSQPFIKVTGDIIRKGKRERVQGMAWLDREWSSQFLSRTQQGWDWFALRLDDQSTLMLFQLRDAQSHFLSARRMYPDGTGHTVAQSTTGQDAISLIPLVWQQTATGRYPVQWQLHIPAEKIALTVTPLNPNSNMPLSVRYWEGPVRLSGSHGGTGYMELTGY